MLSDVFAVNAASEVFWAGGAPERFSAHEVSGSFFPGLGVRALAGRTIGLNDDHPGVNHVAVLSYSFWSLEFGRDPAIVGATVYLTDEPFAVVGVMRPNSSASTADRSPIFGFRSRRIAGHLRFRFWDGCGQASRFRERAPRSSHCSRKR